MENKVGVAVDLFLFSLNDNVELTGIVLLALKSYRYVKLCNIFDEISVLDPASNI